MKVWIVAGNQNQAEHYARHTLSLRKDEWSYLRRVDLLRGVRGHTVILGPYYHRGMRLDEIRTLYGLSQDKRITLLHELSDKAAITEAIASYRASLAE